MRLCSLIMDTDSIIYCTQVFSITSEVNETNAPAIFNTGADTILQLLHTLWIPPLGLGGLCSKLRPLCYAALLPTTSQYALG